MTRCSRLWEAEAVRDGRVKGDERFAFERHAATCNECSSAIAFFAELAGLLGELPVDRPDALTVRRERHRLLASVDGAIVNSKPRRHAGTRLAFALVATLSLAAAVAFLSLRHLRRVAEPAARVLVDAHVDGRWAETQSDHLTRVTLEEGSFALRIWRPTSSWRVIILLPDGEIEDIGTALQIVVHDGATRIVAVDEGTVLLRLRGRAERRLQAGDSWSIPPDRISPPPALPEPSSPTVVRDDRAWNGLPKKAHLASDSPRPTPPSRKLAVEVPSLGSDETAMAEDRAYLGVTQLLRSGRPEQARRAAQEYLHNFPGGFRRPEMTAVAGDDVHHQDAGLR